MGLTGRISETMLNAIAPDLLSRSVFVCGPDGFMQGVKSIFEAIGFPMQNYQQESFGGKKAGPPPANAPSVSASILSPTVKTNGKGHHPGTLTDIAAAAVAPAAVATATAPTASIVNFAKSGQEILADGSSSILELAEQGGIKIRSGCRVGACGACKVLTRQGQVRYDSPPQALSPKDQQAGYALACVAYPTDRLIVEA